MVILQIGSLPLRHLPADQGSDCGDLPQDGDQKDDFAKSACSTKKNKENQYINQAVCGVDSLKRRYFKECNP